MKNYVITGFLGILLLTACVPTATSTPDAKSPNTIQTDTPLPQGTDIPVWSTSDNGNGSLRQALLDARPYDTVSFAPDVFKPDSPATITVTSALPPITQGHLTIDASNAGVILDGSGLPEDRDTWIPGLSIDSEWNIIQGLQIVNFTGAGIALYEHASHNLIGGDPQLGSGPLGQGNLSSGNSDGIGLMGAGYNIIAGNQIGMDIGNNAQGNRGAGIFITDTAPGNVIGPDNVIAFSGDPGIDIRSVETKGTTITRNSIHDNAAGIRSVPRGLSTPIAPVILTFDLAGTVSGLTCPFCKVEVFSGEGAGAVIYEGSVKADAQGAFTLSTTNPLSGPSLKATSTGTDGSTSVFSLPTTGVSRSEILQDGNELPVSLFYALSSEFILEDNRIGTHGYFPNCWENAPFLLEMAGLGLKRVRLSFNEMEIPIDLERPDFSIDSNHDACVNFMLKQGMTLTYILCFWDKQYQANAGNLPCSRFKTDEEIDRYIDYVRLVVEKFSADFGVHYYEIWNEPDAGACTQGIDVNDYIDLVDIVAPEIKNIDPNAKVVVGAVSGLHSPDSQEYLMEIVSSNRIMPMVDVISWHPFYGPSPESTDYPGYYDNYPSLVQEIKTLAYASGFTGEFRADELIWRTPLGYHPDQPWTYEEITAAKYYARSIIMHLGMDMSSGVDVDSRLTIVYSTVRNLATIMAGNTPTSRVVEIASPADNIASYGFTLPNSEVLFALWTNAAAEEYDPGVSADLTFYDLCAEQVVGIDALYGFEQELETEMVNGDLVIRDLLVKDYPIIIKFINTAP